jgi:hypothetical protein
MCNNLMSIMLAIYIDEAHGELAPSTYINILTN